MRLDLYGSPFKNHFCPRLWSFYQNYLLGILLHDLDCTYWLRLDQNESKQFKLVQINLVQNGSKYSKVQKNVQNSSDLSKFVQNVQDSSVLSKSVQTCLKWLKLVQIWSRLARLFNKVQISPNLSKYVQSCLKRLKVVLNVSNLS